MVACIHRAVSDCGCDNNIAARKSEHIFYSCIEGIGSVINGKSDRSVFARVKHKVVVIQRQLAYGDNVYTYRAVFFGNANRIPSRVAVGFFGNVFTFQTELTAFEICAEFTLKHAFTQRSGALFDYKVSCNKSAFPLCGSRNACSYGILSGVFGGFSGISVAFLRLIFDGNSSVSVTVDFFGIKRNDRSVICFIER